MGQAVLLHLLGRVTSARADEVDEDVGHPLGQGLAPVRGTEPLGEIGVAPPLDVLQQLPDLDGQGQPRFFGVWNRSQSRSAANRRRSSASSSSVKGATVLRRPVPLRPWASRAGGADGT